MTCISSSKPSGSCSFIITLGTQIQADWQNCGFYPPVPIEYFDDHWNLQLYFGILRVCAARHLWFRWWLIIVKSCEISKKKTKKPTNNPLKIGKTPLKIGKSLHIPPLSEPKKGQGAAWFGSSTSALSSSHKVLPVGKAASARYGRPSAHGGDHNPLFTHWKWWFNGDFMGF